MNTLSSTIRQADEATVASNMASQDTATRRINLALQGGGAHGAFTWGVLDRLLEEERLEFDGISATSAGAMNATVLAYGYQEGGRAGAKVALANFWRRIAHAASLSPFQATWWDKITGNQALESSPSFMWLDFVSRVMSPYQLNPMNWNPLREVLLASVDFNAFRNRPQPIKLFLSATNVRTGKVKVFDGTEVSAEAVLASGCLPFLFQAVEIDGEHYWDGGYMGNPAIFPLIYNTESADIVVVHINPMTRNDLPVTASEIINRINEISFNSSLMREMRAINFVSKLIGEHADHDDATRNLKRLHIHSISAEQVMQKLSVLSKLNADWDFLLDLKEAGRSHAEAWVGTNFDAIGVRSSVDIAQTYL
ncbi:patatin-like phospholipase family protein [Dongia sp.]|uniref:patatin-like phospholipase family protein n=1 Tax=Dongia sp. TaxID=1977262 RepID=UPI0035B2A8D5